MEAYRQTVDIKNHTLNLLLPDKFKNGRVEVILLPYEEQTKTIQAKPSEFRGCISKGSANSMLNSLE